MVRKVAGWVFGARMPMDEKLPPEGVEGGDKTSPTEGDAANTSQVAGGDEGSLQEGPWVEDEEAPERPQRSLKSLSTYAIGQLGEDAACRYVLEQGFEIVERNWRSYFGEADIVALDGETVTLIEVKTRVNDGRAEQLVPEVAITREKRERYARIASQFMAIHPDIRSIRFDVASVELFEHEEPHIRYTRNAYEWDD